MLRDDKSGYNLFVLAWFGTVSALWVLVDCSEEGVAGNNCLSITDKSILFTTSAFPRPSRWRKLISLKQMFQYCTCEDGVV